MITPGKLIPDADAQLAIIGTADTTGDLDADCSKGTYSVSEVDVAAVRTGGSICVRTDEKRYAIMRFVSEKNGQFVFVVTTFNATPNSTPAPTT